MIGWENYEEYIILHADGELKPAEEQELMAFINANPQLRSELDAYTMTRIPADETIIYANKKSLLKPEATKRIIAFPQWQRYAVAASVAALLFIGFYKYRTTDGNISEMAQTDTIKQVMPAPQSNIPAPVAQAPKQEIAVTIPTPSIKTPTTIIHHKTQQRIQNNTITNNQPEEKNIAITEHKTPETPITELSAIAVTGPKTLPGTIAQESVTIAQVPDLPIVTQEQSKKATLWERLPIDEDKKKNMENIAGNIADAYTCLNKAKQKFDVKKPIVRIEKKKLILSF